MAWGWVHFQQFLFFWVNCSFNKRLMLLKLQSLFAKIEKLVQIVFLLTHFFLKLWPESPRTTVVFCRDLIRAKSLLLWHHGTAVKMTRPTLFPNFSVQLQFPSKKTSPSEPLDLRKGQLMGLLLKHFFFVVVQYVLYFESWMRPTEILVMQLQINILLISVSQCYIGSFSYWVCA